MVVIGPGSLFSSVLPNLLISDIRDAVAAATGVRVYICNVATQPGETGTFTAAAHLEALFHHIGDGLIDYALLNSNHAARRPEGWLGEPVRVDERRLEELPVTVIEEDLVDVTNAHRHDSAKLATALDAPAARGARRARAPSPAAPSDRLRRLLADAGRRRAEGRARPHPTRPGVLPSRRAGRACCSPTRPACARWTTPPHAWPSTWRAPFGVPAEGPTPAARRIVRAARAAVVTTCRSLLGDADATAPGAGRMRRPVTAAPSCGARC